jgi:hypothetical protein
MKQHNILLLVIFLLGCSIESSDSEYLRWVGDAEFNPEIDREAFQLCGGENQVKQYFNFSEGLQYQGEKSALIQFFMEKYRPVESEQSGWIRIRFIVNCKGETGRFRMISSDENYVPQKFDPAITTQLMALTQSLEGWKLLPTAEEPEDYYQYLVFKIQNGTITEIMP